MKKSVYTVWAALLGAGMVFAQAQTVLAQDVTLDGAPVVLTVSVAGAEEGTEGVRRQREWMQLRKTAKALGLKARQRPQSTRKWRVSASLARHRTVGC